MARDPGPSAALSRPSAARLRNATAGAVAVLVGLGASEAVAGAFGRQGRSVVGAVGEAVIRLVPEPLEAFVVATFGKADKPLFVALMIGVCAGTGSVLATIENRRPGRAALAIGTIAAAAGALTLADPTADPWAALCAPFVGAMASLLSLRLLVQTARTEARTNPSDESAGANVAPPPTRRTFLRLTAALTALAAFSAQTGRWLSARAAQLPAVRLPAPARPAPTLPAGHQAPDASPFTTPNDDFYRVDIVLEPLRVPLQSWRLRVHGHVDRPFELDYEALLALPLVEADATLTCVSNPVGGDLVGNARWLGVPLETLLQRAGVHRNADLLISRAVDGFTVGCPLADARDGRTALVVVGMNGAPLPLAHGFPARLLVAGVYGYVGGTKWLTALELGTRDRLEASGGVRGHATQNPIRTASRIDHPTAGTRVGAGPQVIAGVAWAQARGISRVQVQIDDAPWTDARLAEAPGRDTWRQWSLPWTAAPGRHRLRVRATDGHGETQTETRHRPADGGATGWHTIEVDVG